MEGKRKHYLRPFAAVLACVLIAAMLIPVLAIQKKYGGVEEYWWEKNGGKVQYPCVLVHGLGGWGENSPQGEMTYFGGTTGSLAKYLRAAGYTVCVPSVGPFSSSWDRACELYAQLAGKRVDYGAAHAKAHGHARYGRTYSEAMVPDWGKKINGGQMVKIDLISHSFGGPTIAMLASLLAYGDEAERAATGKNTSALFTGGKADWVQSVTTLCSPHQGSSLACAVEDLGSVVGVEDLPQLIVQTVHKYFLATDGKFSFPVDLMLDQFGIGSKASTESDVETSVAKVGSSGIDHAFYDVSPDGAAKLYQKIRTVSSVYYFSYAFSTTKAGKLLRGQVPDGTNFYLYGTALAIGSYTGTSKGGIVMDETWQENDGLVNVVSAQYPAGAPHADFPDDAKLLKPGVWYVMPTKRGDHGSAVGGLKSTAETHAFFDAIMERNSALKR